MGNSPINSPLIGEVILIVFDSMIIKKGTPQIKTFFFHAMRFVFRSGFATQHLDEQ